ncbi:LOW QUALITY PROTEIN: hypothetical protein PHMEG_00041372 [Phytophthora megakarya]|uniref:Eukaryotic/viral aspartic protease n=1 Tax=Phytophthora megakarya TaxID=4795 RepID=A0A225UC16_9STRA|nr:LOW QUALITY PROTEIN: hypothetical protein PHMEG_00041372 [Phytophthora megakarya]
MDFMVPAGIRLDLADGSLCLPDEVRIQLSGRRQLFSGSSRMITFDQHGNVPVAGSVEIAVRRSLSDKQKLWVTRGDRWVPTGGDIFPEDIENHMAVLPEVEATTREVTIDDIRIQMRRRKSANAYVASYGSGVTS